MALGNFEALREGLCFEIRAMRNRSPHCGTGVLARRFVFTGLEFWSVWRGSVKATGEGARFTFGERAKGERRKAKGERRTGNGERGTANA